MPQYRSTSALAFHEGNSTLSLNDWHAPGLICSANDFGVRVDVDPGSKPARDGVTRAFRFCVIESSIDDRDRRKKSEACQQAQFLQVALHILSNRETVSHTTQRAGRKAKLRRKARQSGRLRHDGLRLLRATHSFRCWSGAFPQNVRQYVGGGVKEEDENGTRIRGCFGR